MKNLILSATIAASFCIGGAVIAAPNSNIGNFHPGLTGNVATDYWNEMTRQKLGISEGTNAFGQLHPDGPQDDTHPAAIPLDYIFSQNRPNGARLYRTAGSGIVANAGLYDTGGMGSGLNLPPTDPLIAMLMNGTVTHEYLASRTDISAETFTDPFKLRIQMDTPVTGLETVVFQINIFGMKINEGYVTPFEMTEMLFPVTLTINGTQEILPLHRELVFAGSYTGGGNTGGDEAEGSETWAFQWDLRGLAIESFAIDFTVYPHASTRGLRIDQSDLYTQVLDLPDPIGVPEPSTWGLIITGITVYGFVSRRRTRRENQRA